MRIVEVILIKERRERLCIEGRIDLRDEVRI
jgi:hypothetical protein